MRGFLSFWSRLDMRRRLIVAGATVGVFLAVLALARTATEPGMALLYAGLDSADAGKVIASLDQRGIAHDVRGESIYVPSDQRDEVRLALAAEGLPATGAAGYELLDSLSGFGTTAEMFDAAYWRAKEGELARTILALPQVKQARVHIARADPQPFRPDVPPTASVTVTTAGGSLTVAQARAVKHLVASAVAGLRPEDVEVIDSEGGLISTGDETGMIGGDADTRAQELKRRVERLLEARVGAGNAVVEIAVDLVTDRESLSERRFDPAGRVAALTDTEERKESSTSSGGSGQVTVASNLPDNQPEQGDTDQSSQASNRERITYELSETQRQVERSPGSIKRLSVAVLLNDPVKPGPDGAALPEPRPQEELDLLRELVQSAVGFDQARGDQITLRSMQFIASPQGGSVVQAGFLGRLDMNSLARGGVLAAVALILGLFVVRPMVLGRAAQQAPSSSLALALRSPGEASLRPEILNGEIDDSGDFSVPVGAVVDGEVADPVSRLRRLIEQRQAESLEILRSWMDDREEKV